MESYYKMLELIKNAEWYKKSVFEAYNALETSSDGLNSAMAKKRLEYFGKNEIEEKEQEPAWKLLFNQFKSLLIIILILSAILSAVYGKEIEAISIIIIVILAGVLGFVQEFKAGKAIEALKKMAAPHTIALRDGKEVVVATSDIVPGDVLIIKSGDKIPADLRIIESKNLKIDEAALTGESLSVEKLCTKLDGESIPLGDRKNMLYMGTSVAYGRGKAVVVATGMTTEFGKIATLLQSTDTRKTPLQTNLDNLGKRIGIFAIVLAALMSLLGVFRNYPLNEMFVWGVALAVAIIPEALPAVVTISLALGVRRMVKRKALIRKLPAVETLGATTIICSDKTGTLTQDQMTIRKIYTNGKCISLTGTGYSPFGEFFINEEKLDPSSEKELIELLKAGSLCGDTLLKKEAGSWSIIGDPTEGSIVVAAAKAGIYADELKSEQKRIDEIPFSSERKKMTTIHQSSSRIVAYSKGAPEEILAESSFILQNGELIKLTPDMKNEVLLEAQKLGEEALRVLGISYKELTNSYNIDSVESEMVFLGFVGMIDPPRYEVRDAIKICEKAGIKPIMITGDHKITAVAIAKELGILKGGQAISGVELEALSSEDFDKTAANTEVYARISPEHKLKIVDALMRRGNIVAMTGDGVNDAPALKKADIGVAMGITGTDVSKEAADMILTDDNFASIVAAVEEGRSIFENIRKYLVFLLSGNIGKVLAMLICLLFALPIPLTAVQILFMNFIMDGLMAIALGVEPPEPGIMNKEPRKVKEGVLNHFSILFIGSVGTMIGLLSVGVFYLALEFGYSEMDAMTIFFYTLIFSRLFNAYNCRSLVQPIFKLNMFSNRALIYSAVGTVAMIIAISENNFLREVFHITLMGVKESVFIFLASITIFIFVEIAKIIKIKTLLPK